MVITAVYQQYCEVTVKTEASQARIRAGGLQNLTVTSA